MAKNDSNVMSLPVSYTHLALRDNLAAATGYDKTQQGGTSQSAKAGGFTAMTQDQGTKLEGMFLSLIHICTGTSETIRRCKAGA